ncbi:TrbC/VirB2 family protein [Insolitispirillum peregrinum]|uniref:TrbC/VirB2 family protein n=1 Tax=Insolitispirillum peregrinum TaxID=80876 RepID=UPI003613D4DE
MNIKSKITRLGALAMALAMPKLALAADWTEPATDIIENFTDGLLEIAVPIIGLVIIAYGIWGVVTTNLEGRKLFIIIAAGALIFAGGSIAAVFGGG